MIALLSQLDERDAFWARWDERNRAITRNHPLLQSRFVRPMIGLFTPDGAVLIDGGETDFDNALLLSPQRRLRGLIAGALHPSQTQISLSLVGERCTNFLTHCVRSLPAPVQRLDCYAVDARFQSALLSQDARRVPSERGRNMSIAIHGSFEGYWAARSKNLRKNMNRYANRSERDFPGLELRCLRQPGDMTMAVARYGFLESRGWKGHGGTAIHPANLQGAFYEQVLQEFARTGDARVYELWAGERLLASRLCVGNGEMLVILKTTFDEDARDIAPGRMLLRSILEELFETDPGLSLEFYTNATKEQLAWATDEHPIHDVSFYRSSWVPRMAQQHRSTAAS